MTEFQKRLNVRIRGEQKKYFEDQKKRLGSVNDSEAVRSILNEHKKLLQK